MGRIWNDDEKDEQQKDDEQRWMLGVQSGASWLRLANSGEEEGH